MPATKSARTIIALPEKCSGCLTCEMRCSLRFEKSFLLESAAIRVRRTGRGDYRMSFTGRCDGCGICARFCMYGALVQPAGGR